MNDKPRRPTHDELLAGEVCITSILNEPLDFDFAMKAESAFEIARRRWHMTQEGEAHER